MSTQTAVEWLEDQIFKSAKFIDIDLFQVIEQAKEMEKEQMLDSWVDGTIHWDSEKTFEQYYNETYGGDND